METKWKNCNIASCADERTNGLAQFDRVPGRDAGWEEEFQVNKFYNPQQKYSS